MNMMFGRGERHTSNQTYSKKHGAFVLGTLRIVTAHLKTSEGTYQIVCQSLYSRKVHGTLRGFLLSTYLGNGIACVNNNRFLRT